jgi:hypothetical protein
VHENRNEVQSPVRLLGTMCNLRARARILRIRICFGPEQERSCATNAADCPTKGCKSLLREDHRVWYSAAMRSGVRDFSDHRQRDGGYRAPVGEIIISPTNGGLAGGTLPDAAAPTVFCFLFPTH